MTEQEPFTIPCPHCQGQGQISGIACGTSGCRSLIIPCDTCQGRGTLSDIQSARLQAGSCLQRARRAKGHTQRTLAAALGWTPLDLNRYEHGQAEEDMPEYEHLLELVKALPRRGGGS